MKEVRDMGKKFKTINGITLVSLVITIVIMLILAAVALSLVIGQNGLFTKAKASVDISEKRAAEEKVNLILGEYSMDHVDADKDLDTFLNEKVDNNEIESFNNNNDGTYTIKEDKYNVVVKTDDLSIVSSTNVGEVVKQSRDGLKVGDYVKYEPDDKKSSAYSKDKLSLEKTGSDSNKENIVQDDLTWQILRIYDDGRVDLIGSPTSQKICFCGVLAYNNGVYFMNDICKSLYSKESKGITARSVNLKDLEYWLGQSTKGIETRKNYSNGYVSTNYGDEKQYSGGYNYWPTLYEKTTDESDSYYKAPTTDTYKGGSSDQPLNVKQTYYYIQITEDNFGEGCKVLCNNTSFWIATRFTSLIDKWCGFGLRYSDTGMNGWTMYDSYNKEEYKQLKQLRPVVTLGSTVKISKSDTASNSETPHLIASY